MAIVRFVFAALKPGVDAADYERFEREVDYAVSEKIKTIVNYRTHRITETGAGLSGGPWDYVERIEVTDRAAYEAELAVAFNDVDLCLKLGQAGWKIVYTPEAVAEHRESISRGNDFDECRLGRFMRENEVMRQRYVARLAGDSFYNLHFSRDGGVYRELRVVRSSGVQPPEQPPTP